MIPCPDCSPPLDLEKPWDDRRRDHEKWRSLKHASSVNLGESIPTIDRVIEKLPFKPVVASTADYIVVSCRQSTQMNSRQLVDFKRALSARQKRWPTIFNSDDTIDPHERLHIHIDCCAETAAMFWTFFGLEKAPRRPLPGSGVEFFLFDQESVSQVYESLHNGSGGIRNATERQGLRLDSGNRAARDSRWTEEEDLAAKISDRLCIGLSRVFLRESSSNADYTKFSLWCTNGISNCLGLRRDGRIVGTVIPYERPARNDRDEFGQNPRRLIRREIEDPERAPIVASIARLDPTGERGQPADYTALWSLVEYLQANDKTKFATMVSLSTKYDLSTALWQAYGVTEPRLNASWYAWLKATNGGSVAPLVDKLRLKPTISSEIIEDFDVFVASKLKLRTDARLSAVESLKYADLAAALPRLLEVVMKRPRDEAALAVEILRQRADPSVATAVADILAQNSAEAEKTGRLYYLLRIAGRCEAGHSGIVGSVVGIASDETRDYMTQADSLRALAEIGNKTTATVAAAASSRADPVVRAEAASALARLSSDRAGDLARTLIDDDSWHVRLASIGILRKLGDQTLRWSAIPILITRLGREDGRLREDIVDALKDISKVDKGDDPLAWRTWWENDGKKADDRRSAQPADRYEGPLVIFPKIYSKKFVILLDISTSMKRTINIKEGYGTTTAVRTKYDLIKRDLIAVISSPKRIPDDVTFNLFVFADDWRRWKDRLMKCDSSTRKSATDWIAPTQVEAGRLTNLQSCLQRLFDDADEASLRGQGESTFDTVYIASDGQLTAGVTDHEDLLRYVQERNRLHHIRFNTITIGALDSVPQFMRDLANQNYGTSHLVR